MPGNLLIGWFYSKVKIAKVLELGAVCSPGFPGLSHGLSEIVESNSCDLAPTTNQDNGVWLDHDSGGPNALVTRESKKNELIGSSIIVSPDPRAHKNRRV